MKTFRLKADFTFEAEDIDDALDKLSAHFAEPDESRLLTGGGIELFASADQLQQEPT